MKIYMLKDDLIYELEAREEDNHYFLFEDGVTIAKSWVNNDTIHFLTMTLAMIARDKRNKMTVTQCARHLHVDNSTIYAWISRGLKHITEDKIYVMRKDLESFSPRTVGRPKKVAK